MSARSSGTRFAVAGLPGVMAVLAAAVLVSAPLETAAQTVRVDVIKQPYKGSRNVAELSMNPDYIHASGLEGRIAEWGGEVVRPIRTVRLDDEQQRQYGEWNRLALANGNFAEMVAETFDPDVLTVGLEANCSSLLGMLAGLQRAPDGTRRRVGLVFIDAHGDFNTPETTLSGMLGGMPVAVAAGHALERLRLTSGLADPLPMEHIVWGGVRDLDPLERDRFEEYGVREISVEDIRTVSENLHAEMRRLSEITDVIYIHIDMDVLDPAEVPGHDLAVEDGPSSMALGAALTAMFRYPKAVALGLASTPAGNADPDELSRRAALNLIRGAMEGVRSR